MDRFFTVVVELQDGRSDTLRLPGENASSVFQQVKQRPDVRRVGKVTDVTAGGAAESPRAAAANRSNGRAPAANGRAAAPAPVTRQPERTSPLTAREMGNVITGPRVVVQTARTGGEQPFRHLQAPPERPKPAVVAEPPKPAAPAHAAVLEHKPNEARHAEQTPAGRDDASSQDGQQESAPGREYRILRSRRRDGQPYLLQRGRWDESNGKRQFEAQWEKGFAAREQAEKHLGWLQQHEQDIADLDPQAA